MSKKVKMVQVENIKYLDQAQLKKFRRLLTDVADDLDEVLEEINEAIAKAEVSDRARFLN